MAYIYDLTDTWNSGGTTFNGIKLNVTDSASASPSKLVTLQTNGTEHFSITKAGVGYVSGNLGVGTSSPSFKLDVSGDAHASGSVFTGSDANGWGRLFNTGGALYFQAGSLNSGSATAQPFIFTNMYGGAERMRIDASGNVGIGTSSIISEARFQVVGGAIVGQRDTTGTFGDFDNRGQLILRGATNVDKRLAMGVDTSAGTMFGVIQAIEAGVSTRNLALNPAGGNVGIGTSSPTAKVTISQFAPSVAGGQLLVKDPSFSGVALVQGGAGEGYLWNTSNNFLSIATNNAERMRIDNAGRVLIGTTATVGGTWSNEVKQTSSGVWPWGLNCVDRGLIVRNSSASSGFYAYFEYNGGTNNGSISWSGGTTSYNTTSDYRLKNIDGPLTNSGAYIDALKPVEGSWKADGKRFIGFLAHQVQEVSQTSVVVGEKDGKEMQQMDYSAPELIANLIAEVQSLRARVAQLEGN
jgi:hypothetical protein